MNEAGLAKTVAAAGKHVSDSAGHAAGPHGHGGEGVMDIISHHLSDTAPIFHLPPLEIGGFSLDLSITKYVILLWVAAGLVLLFGLLGRRTARQPLARPSRFSGFVEVFILFVRNDVVLENMGKHGLRWTPYFISLFFFILFSNLIGLIPYSSTTTGNVAVTAGLSLLSFLLIQLVGMIEQGWLAYWKNIVPMGVPWPLWFIMWPIEFIGLFTKPFALTIRLFANMTAGHVVIIVLLYMIFQFKSLAVAPFSVAGAIAINMLEVFVSFLQAYIFTMLTALFVGSAMHRH